MSINPALYGVPFGAYSPSSSFYQPQQAVYTPQFSPAYAYSGQQSSGNDFAPLLLQIMQLLLSAFSGLLDGNTQPQPQPQTNPVQISRDDMTDYFLAGSHGGTTGTSEVIEGRYARPGSRFANAGANEFDAVTAYAYSGQFKAYAMGLDVVFNPGDNVNQLSANLDKALKTQFTPEAELLSKVAAVYRGDLTGVNKYNNRALQSLLVKWGRSDLARQPGVGITDVESIGSVVRALNDESNPNIRKAWLQDIFDFQNNTPSSPSGAVPNAPAYQQAISIVRGGQLDQLLANYRAGIKTGNSLTGTQPGTVRPIPQA